MDPLSMTAGLIAILRLSTNLVEHLNSLKYLPHNSKQDALAVELSNLFALLTTLRYRVEASPNHDPWFSQIRALAAKHGPFDQFQLTLATTLSRLDPERKKDQVKLLSTEILTNHETDQLLRHTERLKTLLNLALRNDLLAFRQAVHDDLITSARQVSQAVTRVGLLQLPDNGEDGTETNGGRDDENRDYQKEEALRHQATRWRDWLGAPDPSSNYQSALAKRHPGTGLWLLQSQQFQRWKHEPSLMWLHGIPGCGKTVLSATLLNSLVQDRELSATVISYFYFDFNDAEKQSSKKAIRSLLLQDAQQDQHGANTLTGLYNKYRNRHQQPAEDEILSTCRGLFTMPKDKYIILDALDECTDRENILSFIKSITQLENSSLHILVTSRQERDIVESLSPDINIEIDSAGIDQDIRLYIQNFVATDRKLMKWPAGVREEIVQLLTENSGGMFQWVFCQLLSIRQCIKLSNLWKTLSSLPKSLDDTYYRILQHLESNDYLSAAIPILQWLAFSNRPLCLSEVCEIIAIKTGENGNFSPEDRLLDPTDIFQICSSLIVCSSVNDDGNKDIDNKTYSRIYSGNAASDTSHVRLAHFSVREYLLSDRCFLHSNFQTTICHKEIAEACLLYLLNMFKKEPLTEATIRQHPLANYAAENWWQHAQMVGEADDDRVYNLASRLLGNEDIALLPWLQLCNPDPPWSGLNLSLTSDQVPKSAYYACLIGLPQVIQILELGKGDLNIEGGYYGNALQAASVRGHDELAQILLEAGADVNNQGGHFGSALQAASAKGHERLVKMLLEAGADVDTRGGVYGNALQAAAAEGHKALVKMLLEAGAVVDAHGGVYGTSLQAAAAEGNIKVVQMLLEAGATLDAQGGLYGTALQAAIARRNEKVVQFLREAGAQEAGNWERNDPEFELESVLSTLIGSLDSLTKIDAARNYLRRLFNEDPRLEPFFFSAVEFSTLGQQGLADTLKRHFTTFAYDLAEELNAKRGSVDREACKLVLYHARSLASEIAQVSHRQEGQEVFASLHLRSKEPDRSYETQRFLVEQNVNRNLTSADESPAGKEGSEYTGEDPIDDNIERNSDSGSSLSDQIDPQSLVFESFSTLFEQSNSFRKMVDGLWNSLQPDLFDWCSIETKWREELRESPPIGLRYFMHGDIVHVSEEQIDLFDRLKLSLENFTAQPWDWRPFRPPRRPIATGKIRLVWDSCCARTQSFDVSPMLAEKIMKFTKVAINLRKDIHRPGTSLMNTRQPNYPQAHNSSSGDISEQILLSQPIVPPITPQKSNLSLPQPIRKPVSAASAVNGFQQKPPRQPGDRFILLCVRNMSGPNSLQQSQIQVSENMTDNGFFDEFRKHYRDLRGWYYWLHPDQFWFCHSSRFYKWDVDKISWEDHEMPSESSYRYVPKPPPEPYALPVSRDEWEHRYHQNCSLALRSDFLGRIPTRSQRFEITTCANAHQVWGLHAEYRTSTRVVLAWSFFCISPGILFFILWLTRFANDLQNASVPVMFILSFVLLPIGLVTLGAHFKGIQGA